MKKYLLLSFLLCVIFQLIAQKPTYNFGKVSNSQLEMTSYAADTSAAAVVLHDFGEIQITNNGDGFEQNFTRCRRIKIMSRAGFDYGNLEIGYFSKNDSEVINDIEAVITLPNRQTYTYKKQDFFTEQKSEYWSVKKLAIANLEVGAVIDYYYKMTSDRVVQPREWYFQGALPIVTSQLEIDFHQHFSYMYLFQGFEGMTKTKEGESTIYSNEQTQAIVEAKKFTVKNVPALKSEPYITTIDDYRLRLRFQCTDYYTRNGQQVKLLSDWDKINQKMFFHEYFGKQYQKSAKCGKILKAANSIIEAQLPTLEKATALYDFVNDNMEYNRSSGFFVRKSLNDAFEKKNGSKGELNLMLVALLQKSGIDAYPMLISQRSNGRPLKNHPIADQFNYVIVQAMIDGKEYFVECGNVLRPFGELSKNSMNDFGFLVKKKAWEWREITADKAKEVYMSNFSLNEEGKMTGTINANYTNTTASKKRYEWVNEEQEKNWERQLDRGISDYELDSVMVENERQVTESFKVNFAGDFSGAAQEIGGIVYITPFIFAKYSENPFKSEDRKYAVNFAYPFGNQFIINLKYDPEIYEVESLPEKIKAGLPEKSAKMLYAIQEKAPGWIQVNFNLSVNSTLFSPSAYISLRTLFDITEEKLGEPIILKRK